MRKRQLYLEDYEFYWSPATGFRNRLIIPFRNEGKIVGYTARAVNDESRSKYLSDQQPGYVFNVDNQRDWRRKFCVIVEGPVDAIYLDGVALLGSEIKDQQSMLINHLNKTNIVVPDRDSSGEKLIEQAIENEWMVSMPSWDEDVNDPGDAVLKYGRLYTLHSIVSEAESSPLKIRLKAKKWFG
jgi:DNA primase